MICAMTSPTPPGGCQLMHTITYRMPKEIVPDFVEIEGGGPQPPFGITGMHSKGG